MHNIYVVWLNAFQLVGQFKYHLSHENLKQTPIKFQIDGCRNIIHLSQSSVHKVT